jgi:hypothetical protein
MRQLISNFYSIFIIVLLVGFEAYCDNISNIQFNPISPASLTFNQNVSLTFDYTTDEAGGVRIFARPFSNGSLTPNYAASGSPIYPSGSGSGSGNFTITSGDIVVDEIRFQMWDANQTSLLLEFFIPVQFIYSVHSVSDIVLNPLTPTSLGFNQNVDITFNYTTNETGGVRIWARPFTNGSLSPNYAASGSPIYPVGSGSGSGNFTITSGDVVVDEIRFQMWDANQTTLLLEFFIPVEYHFAAHSISHIQLSPDYPASLAFNQNVQITFDYSTEEASGVRIWARPFTNGSLTPNYAASGSPIYPVGNGNGSASFSITSGEVIVDELRFQMWDANQTTLLLEFFIPVEYHFSTHSISNIELTPPPPAFFTFNQNVNITFDYTTDESGGVRIWARPFTNGTLTPNYVASGSPIYPVGSGSGSGSFSITSGEVIVDEIRYQMWDANQTTLLLEFFVPVEYQFGLLTSIISNEESHPVDYYLSQNYPNPFNPSTKIVYSIPSESFVNLKIYNAIGHEITELVNEEKSIGTYEVNFNAEKLPSGVYFYTLRAGKFLETKKMILLK